MKKYKVICIDMFQTLVDIGARSKNVWKRILGDNYTEDLWKKYSTMSSKNIVNKFHEEHSISSEFLTLRCIFESSFAKIFNSEDVGYNPLIAAQILIEEHNKAAWYDDSLSFLKKVSSQYKVCLVSDADFDMVEKKLEEVRFDKIFISEGIQSYKRNPNGKMFFEVLNHYKCKPEEILHIGDSSSDIIGANSQKIDTCWINRHEYSKQFSVVPTYEVKNLIELEQELF